MSPHGRCTNGRRKGEYLKFTFTRTDRSETSDVALRVQVSPDLIDWTTAPGYDIGAASVLPNVMVTENGLGDDLIEVLIPQGSDAMKYARLKVTISP